MNAFIKEMFPTDFLLSSIFCDAKLSGNSCLLWLHVHTFVYIRTHFLPSTLSVKEFYTIQRPYECFLGFAGTLVFRFETLTYRRFEMSSTFPASLQPQVFFSHNKHLETFPLLPRGR